MNGFREGRSPDVLGVADGTLVYTDLEGLRMPWPAAGTLTDLACRSCSPARASPRRQRAERTTLDRVAPTVSEILGFEREHPEVRSGTAVAGIANGEPPSLVLLVGGRASARPSSRTIRKTGRSSRRCSTMAPERSKASGIAPDRPAATLTTVGTGACRRSTGSPARSSGTARAGREAFRPGLPVAARSSRRSPTTSTTRTIRRSSGSSRPTNAIAGSSAAAGIRARIPSTW